MALVGESSLTRNSAAGTTFSGANSLKASSGNRSSVMRVPATGDRVLTRILLLRAFQLQRFGESGKAKLCRAVVRLAEIAEQPGRGRGHQYAAIALFAHRVSQHALVAKAEPVRCTLDHEIRSRRGPF